ncbi:hypothetical protein FE257_006973 [Aspergillus nanangensis]|uniref:Acetyl coenzyme A transporter n=1 Tax=Aspergillus nanangensis TaxID=2582783 RepID=A0AAD4CP92_ASPNN|nr:hypothetical protein FE257_006973 [Aspergillus nanangensis]
MQNSKFSSPPIPRLNPPSPLIHSDSSPHVPGSRPDSDHHPHQRPDEVELQPLACAVDHAGHETGSHLPPPSQYQDPFLSSSDSDSDVVSADDLLDTRPDGSSSHRGRSTQMKNKGRTLSKRRSKPVLSVATGQNGHAHSEMTSNIEMRKRDTSTESPAARASRYTSHPNFSLDQDPPLTPQTPAMTTTSFANLPASDRRNFLVLCVLYFLQGVPMGLATGSVPFLLKPYLSYGQIGVFSLASYPYSLKLLWSPIVDAVWSRRFGRRKSWITPVQVIAGLAMIYMSGRIEDMMKSAGANGGAGVWNFACWWFLLVLFCATQDIAVDGWAITLMSPPNISYASTAQTVGLTAGHFLSYTVFLAFNSADFANRYFRATPAEGGLLSLGTYLSFWGWAYLIVTTCLAVMKKEDHTLERDSILDVYKSMWNVLKLKNIQTIILVHLIAKIGFQANDGVTSLKLLDKGFGQDNMALVVLIDFPFEICLGYYAGKWSTEHGPMRLWCWAFMGRLAAAVLAQATVMVYPAGTDVPFWYLLMVIGEHLISTFMNTVMFVSVSAFHARIADPAIGGTYMTMLATVSNLGGTFPRYFVLKLVDMFTEATCVPPSVPLPSDQLKGEPVTSPFSCALEPDKARCVGGGGTCNTIHDGYYTTNVLCVLHLQPQWDLHLLKRGCVSNSSNIDLSLYHDSGINSRACDALDNTPNLDLSAVDTISWKSPGTTRYDLCMFRDRSCQGNAMDVIRDGWEVCYRLLWRILDPADNDRIVTSNSTSKYEIMREFRYVTPDKATMYLPTTGAAVYNLDPGRHKLVYER